MPTPTTITAAQRADTLIKLVESSIEVELAGQPFKAQALRACSFYRAAIRTLVSENEVLKAVRDSDIVYTDDRTNRHVPEYDDNGRDRAAW